MPRRSLASAALVLPVICGLLLASCGREYGPSGDVQVQALQLKEELDRTKKRLGMAERKAAEAQDAAALAKDETESAAKKVAEKERALADKDVQIAALEKQIADLKKGEAQVYVEASKLHQQGMNSTSLLHYRQFIAAYPSSPLVVDANRAISEISTSVPAPTGVRAATPDPHVAERAFQREFAEGFASIESIAAMVKHKSKNDVLRLLGPPNRTFRDNTEFGYVDKIVDPANGERATLVIGFADDQVETLRVGYSGRPMRP
jgi:hypothetical protein